MDIEFKNITNWKMKLKVTLYATLQLCRGCKVNTEHDSVHSISIHSQELSPVNTMTSVS